MSDLKKRGILIAGPIFLVVLALALTWFYFSGYYIKFQELNIFLNMEIILNKIRMNMAQLFLGLIWLATISVILKAIRSYNKLVHETHIKKRCYHIREKHSRTNTDLDALYDLVKENKKIVIKDISKIFSINQETAMEWAKILENGNLVKIEYPAFAEPVLKIKEEENEA